MTRRTPTRRADDAAAAARRAVYEHLGIDPETGASVYMHKEFDKLTSEQQDHLFYALSEARAAADDYWTSKLGTGIPEAVERAIVEQYGEQLAGRV